MRRQVMGKMRAWINNMGFRIHSFPGGYCRVAPCFPTCTTSCLQGRASSSPPSLTSEVRALCTTCWWLTAVVPWECLGWGFGRMVSSHFSCGVCNVLSGARGKFVIYFLKQKWLRKSLMGKFISDYFGKCFPRLMSKSRLCGLSASAEDSADASSEQWMEIHELPLCVALSKQTRSKMTMVNS